VGQRLIEVCIVARLTRQCHGVAAPADAPRSLVSHEIVSKVLVSAIDVPETDERELLGWALGASETQAAVYVSQSMV
jgi:hypothetical protein